jgi:hypothetical protein
MISTCSVQRTILLFLTLFLAGSCGMWMFDWAGKGEKTTCLFLSTKSMEVRYECAAKKIWIITVAGSTGSDGNKRRLLHQKLESPVNDFSLPLNRDTLNGLYVTIEIHATDSHHRESYYLDTEPGDFNEDKVVYARYFSH